MRRKEPRRRISSRTGTVLHSSGPPLETLCYLGTLYVDPRSLSSRMPALRPIRSKSGRYRSMSCATSRVHGERLYRYAVRESPPVERRIGISTEIPLSWYPRLYRSVKISVSVALYQAERVTPRTNLETATRTPRSPARKRPHLTS